MDDISIYHLQNSILTQSSLGYSTHIADSDTLKHIRSKSSGMIKMICLECP
jgi:hypothetical protein